MSTFIMKIGSTSIKLASLCNCLKGIKKLGQFLTIIQHREDHIISITETLKSRKTQNFWPLTQIFVGNNALKMGKHFPHWLYLNQPKQQAIYAMNCAFPVVFCICNKMVYFDCVFVFLLLLFCTIQHMSCLRPKQYHCPLSVLCCLSSSSCLILISFCPEYQSGSLILSFHFQLKQCHL